MTLEISSIFTPSPRSKPLIKIENYYYIRIIIHKKLLLKKNLLKIDTLINDTPTAVGLILSSKVAHNVLMNWWGITKIRISASFAASMISGTAT